MKLETAKKLYEFVEWKCYVERHPTRGALHTDDGNEPGRGDNWPIWFPSADTDYLLEMVDALCDHPTYEISHWQGPVVQILAETSGGDAIGKGENYVEAAADLVLVVLAARQDEVKEAHDG